MATLACGMDEGFEVSDEREYAELWNPNPDPDPDPKPDPKPKPRPKPKPKPNPFPKPKPKPHPNQAVEMPGFADGLAEPHPPVGFAAAPLAPANPGLGADLAPSGSEQISDPWAAK